MTISAKRPAVKNMLECDQRHYEALARKGDVWFLAGCCVCGTWVLGAIGAAMLLYGIWLMRRAQKAGVAIRPWAVTVIGGLILVDSAVNFIGWGLDALPMHDTFLKFVWIDYGLVGDGGYTVFHNTTSVGGTFVPGEKAIQLTSILLIFPLRIAAAWGLLKMKHWGLQWSIIANWMYFTGWFIYTINQVLQADLRFGISDFGVLGFWLMGGIPFMGPIVLLPYLHTVNRRLFSP